MNKISNLKKILNNIKNDKKIEIKDENDIKNIILKLKNSLGIKDFDFDTHFKLFKNKSDLNQQVFDMSEEILNNELGFFKKKNLEKFIGIQYKKKFMIYKNNFYLIDQLSFIKLNYDSKVLEDFLNDTILYNINQYEEDKFYILGGYVKETNRIENKLFLCQINEKNKIIITKESTVNLNIFNFTTIFFNNEIYICGGNNAKLLNNLNLLKFNIDNIDNINNKDLVFVNKLEGNLNGIFNFKIFKINNYIICIIEDYINFYDINTKSNNYLKLNLNIIGYNDFIYENNGDIKIILIGGINILNSKYGNYIPSKRIIEINLSNFKISFINEIQEPRSFGLMYYDNDKIVCIGGDSDLKEKPTCEGLDLDLSYFSEDILENNFKDFIFMKSNQVITYKNGINLLFKQLILKEKINLIIDILKNKKDIIYFGKLNNYNCQYLLKFDNNLINYEIVENYIPFTNKQINCIDTYYFDNIMQIIILDNDNDFYYIKLVNKEIVKEIFYEDEKLLEELKIVNIFNNCKLTKSDIVLNYNSNKDLHETKDFFLITLQFESEKDIKIKKYQAKNFNIKSKEIYKEFNYFDNNILLKNITDNYILLPFFFELDNKIFFIFATNNNINFGSIDTSQKEENNNNNFYYSYSYRLTKKNKYYSKFNNIFIYNKKYNRLIVIDKDNYLIENLEIIKNNDLTLNLAKLNDEKDKKKFPKRYEYDYNTHIYKNNLNKEKIIYHEEIENINYYDNALGEKTVDYVIDIFKKKEHILYEDYKETEIKIINELLKELNNINDKIKNVNLEKEKEVSNFKIRIDEIDKEITENIKNLNKEKEKEINYSLNYIPPYCYKNQIYFNLNTELLDQDEDHFYLYNGLDKSKIFKFKFSDSEFVEEISVCNKPINMILDLIKDKNHVVNKIN